MMKQIAVAAAVVTALSQAAEAETFRVHCAEFEGNRVQFAANPVSPPDQFNRLVRENDRISGLQLELTFSTDNPQAVITSWDNQNLGGEVRTFNVAAVVSLLMLDQFSFVGVDPTDASVNMFSYYPMAGKMLWTIHADRISFVDNIVLGKTFIASCSLSVI